MIIFFLFKYFFLDGLKNIRRVWTKLNELLVKNNFIRKIILLNNECIFGIERKLNQKLNIIIIIIMKKKKLIYIKK